jgi:nucleoid DNA-binding protein
MNRMKWWILAFLLAGLGLGLTWTAEAQIIGVGPNKAPAAPSKAPPAPSKAPAVGGGTLEQDVAKAAKLKEEEVERVFKVLGPLVTARLRRGEAVDLAGLGTLRIVRVEEHKDLVTGLPARIPGVNLLEFLPTGNLNNAANTPGTIPNVVVPPQEFTVNPNANPGLKTEGMRTGRTRVR